MPRLESSASSGGVRSRHRSRGGRVSTALAEINVVPLVDVMLVLLVIFMVTAPMMQQGFDVKLPEARTAKPTTAEPVYVTVLQSFRTTKQVQLGNDLVNLSDLPERVRQAVLTTSTKSIILRGDSSVTFGELIRVWDALSAGGITQISVATQPYAPDK
jgi:biopolymer transport protein ExbD/biopolymer transport protein TolR